MYYILSDKNDYSNGVKLVDGLNKFDIPIFSANSIFFENCSESGCETEPKITDKEPSDNNYTEKFDPTKTVDIEMRFDLIDKYLELFFYTPDVIKNVLHSKHCYVRKVFFPKSTTLKILSNNICRRWIANELYLGPRCRIYDVEMCKHLSLDPVCPKIVSFAAANGEDKFLKQIISENPDMKLRDEVFYLAAENDQLSTLQMLGEIKNIKLDSYIRLPYVAASGGALAVLTWLNFFSDQYKIDHDFLYEIAIDKNNIELLMWCIRRDYKSYNILEYIEIAKSQSKHDIVRKLEENKARIHIERVQRQLINV